MSCTAVLEAHEAFKIGDRLGAIRKLIEWLSSIDTDKLNAFVGWVTELLEGLLGSAPGGVQASVMALSAQEEQEIHGAAFPAAIDLGAIIALIKLIMQLFALLRGTP